MSKMNHATPQETIWGPNVAVDFSLQTYVEKLGEVLGVSLSNYSPGNIDVMFEDTPSPIREKAVRYLFEEILSKYDDGLSSDGKYEKCMQRFFEAEALCKETNARFQQRDFLFQGTTSPEFSVSRALWLAKRKMEWLLGEYSDDAVKDGFGFGPGATTRLPRLQSDLANKLGGIPHATSTAASFVRDILPNYPMWGRALLREGAYCEIVVGNRVVSVPKNYKTDRAIAIEPDWNMFLQKGIGGHIRQQLRRVGIELSDQSNNAFLAGLGSLYGDLATIDLSMASDCMSYELVRFLCPPDWFDALEQCRSPVGELPSNRFVIYEKFSSMGNGATFELETAIFWSLMSSVVELMQLEDSRVLVYGDDIVVPTEAAPNALETLRAAGFLPNQSKTFWEGPFRESCGSHFYEGLEITPIYVKEAVDRLDRLFLLHNNTCRLLERLEPFVQVTPEAVVEFLNWIRSHAPEAWKKPRLPRLDVGDGAFYGSFEECTPRVFGSWSGWSIKTLQARPVVEKKLFRGNLLKMFWQLHTRGNEGFMPIGDPRFSAGPLFVAWRPDRKSVV